MERDDSLVALRVAAIMDGSTPTSYNLVLREITGPRRLVMAVGLTEAQAIAVFMEGVSLPRPLAHDLMAKMLYTLGARVSRVIVDDLENGFFKSTIVCERDGMPILFDSRTSDAVALALRCQAPIFARESVLRIVNGGGGEEEEAAGGRGLPIESMPTATLKKMLSEAVENEDYESAQKMKDELSRRGMG